MEKTMISKNYIGDVYKESYLYWDGCHDKKKILLEIRMINLHFQNDCRWSKRK